MSEHLCQVFFFFFEGHVCSPSIVLTIVVPVQTLEREPQFLLVLLQVSGELVEVQAPIFVLVSGRHDFLQEGDTILIRPAL